MAARQAGKWAIIRNLWVVIWDSFHLGGNPELEVPHDGPTWGDDKVHAFLSVVGMAMDPFGHHWDSCMTLSNQRTSSS